MAKSMSTLMQAFNDGFGALEKAKTEEKKIDKKDNTLVEEGKDEKEK